MKIPFPNSQKVYLQNNRTNVFPMGNLWSTFNVDLQSNVGVVRISPRLKVGASTADDADLGCPVAFKHFNGKIWTIADTHIFHAAGVPDGAIWTDDASSGAEVDYNANYSDLEMFNATLCSTTTDALLSKAWGIGGAGAWTQRDTLTSSTPHVMCYFKRRDRLYYSNNYTKIISIDTSWVAADPGSDYAIDLSPSGEVSRGITCMRAASRDIWIGTYQHFEEGAVGKIIRWDGEAEQATAEYTVNNASGILSLAIDPKTDLPYTMDSNGILSTFNGSGFVEVGRLPIPVNILPYNTTSVENDRFIHPNGMYFTRNGALRVLINNRPEVSTDKVIENFPSGIWEWTKENGFVHIYSFTYNPRASSTITDFGQNRLAKVGALVSMEVASTSNIDGSFMAGATLYTNASSTTSVIAFDNSLDTIQKKGYFVTDWFESNEIADSWDIWWMSYRRFLDSTDNITVKYRIVEEAPVEGTITWVNTTSFTVANSAVVVSNYWTSGTGGEVEILRGTGGGSTVHITNAVLSAGTWTVTIDEVVTGVTTGTATARFQKWIKVFPAESLASPKNWAQFAIGTESTPRIQVKVCFTYTGAGEFYKSILTSNEDIKT